MTKEKWFCRAWTNIGNKFCFPIFFFSAVQRAQTETLIVLPPNSNQIKSKLYLSRVTRNSLSTNKFVALLNVLKDKNLL